jgi:hypothetical protein
MTTAHPIRFHTSIQHNKKSETTNTTTIIILYSKMNGTGQGLSSLRSFLRDTGETWFGPDAREKDLCDETKTVDDILLDYADRGYKVYEVKYETPRNFQARCRSCLPPRTEIQGQETPHLLDG